MGRVAFETLQGEFRRVLVGAGLAEERADVVARIFAENQCDGVYSHGLNRFPGLISGIRNGTVNARASPAKAGGFGGLEQWDGNGGIGIWNACMAMGRAIELASAHGLGCVGLRNTNHWMRGGSYGLQAAHAQCLGICWTNTIPVMPPWGSAEVKIGNNPLVIAVPRNEGPMLLDMAMSQYSNGKLEVLSRLGKALTVAGGYDGEGQLTRSPAAILASRRALPIGYWKGSALAVMLDCAAMLISGGQSSHRIGRRGVESAVSQVFIAIDARVLGNEAVLQEALTAVVDDLRAAPRLAGSEDVRYPGEGMLRTRRESLEKGVLVDDGQFEALRAMGS